MDEQAKLRLITRFYEIGAIKFGEFQLKAGGVSPIYVDLREIISHPKLLEEVSTAMVSLAKSINFDVLCGVPYGALALASTMSVYDNVPMIMCRKESKEHGTKKRIDGKYSPGNICLIVEDVVTTGSSVIETAEVLRAHGLVVKDAVVVLDRQKASKETLARHGISFISILKLDDILANLPKQLDPATREKINEYLESGPAPSQHGQLPENWSLEHRLHQMRHPAAKRLVEIMLKKKSNLCVAVDLTNTKEILQLVESIGSTICALKLHADIIKDFTMEFALRLKQLASANQSNFLIIEDRKFADTGNVVALQTGGLHQLAQWVDAFTVHGVSGPGVLEGLKKVCGERRIACFLVAQMSSEKNLLDENYEKGVLQLASSFPDIVGGFICQRRVLDDPNFLYLSPGVHLEKHSDNLGQQWRSPADAVSRDNVDVVIVGRGVINDHIPSEAAERYREASWQALTNTV